MSVRSLFVPTPDVQQFPNYYLVQLLAKERIRCIMTGEKFGDITPVLVERYLEVPPACQRQEDVQKFIKSEGKMVMESYKRFEKTPMFADKLKELAPYSGNQFEISSVTASGIIVLIEVPEPAAA